MGKIGYSITHQPLIILPSRLCVNLGNGLFSPISLNITLILFNIQLHLAGRNRAGNVSPLYLTYILRDHLTENNESYIYRLVLTNDS